MKNKFSLGILAVGLLSVGVIAGCNKNNNSSQNQVEFSFTVSLSNGSKTLNKGEQAYIVIDEEGGNPAEVRDYTITSSDPSVATVNQSTRLLNAVAKGEVRISVEEAKSGKSKNLQLTITDANPANGGFNYASLAGDAAVAKRTEILGQLEKYAMDNHLTGITLFENGGYVKYSDRVTLPTTNYVTGYGFGLLSEGSIDKPLEKEQNSKYKMYLHSSTSAPDPMKINARNDKGSQVGDLEGYITSSFWGTKLNATKDQYVWYPVLAKSTVTYDGQQTAFDRPIPMYTDASLPETDPNYGVYEEVKPGTDLDPLGLYNTWRIYVKTGADGVKFRYNGASWGEDFDGRNVTVDDYEFAYRFLLTGSHGLVRGTEMAGDQTYGILGARRYNINTKESTDAEALSIWNKMKSEHSLGIETGNDPTNGYYIQLTLLNPIDRFTAMYTLSSSLLSPMSEDFIRTIGGGASNEEHALKEGAKRYGTFNDNDKVPSTHQNRIIDYVLSVGPYMLEDWVKDQAIYFKRNDQWNEPGRYNIEGVKLLIIDSSQSITAVYDRFNNGELDSCGIPSKQEIINKELATGERVYQTKGDSTFKLNVNSCTQEAWNEKFGPDGKISANSNWKLKPWMSNDNFLNGLFYSIDRKTFAKNRGAQPSINYFSNAYLNDPEKGLSYNDTDAHKKAVEAYETYDSNGDSTYGYSEDRAILSFRSAVKELVKQYPDDIKYGSKENPFEITFHIKWMYQTDVEEYGKEIAGYFEKAFNNDRVCEGRIKLKVTQDAVTKWDDVYYEYLMKGQYDLGFGAISGNTYNPLNFMEVLKSDNSSGFTLNWGTDTSKITKNKPLIYEDKMWSFDALWAVADHGGVVDEGSIAKTVEKCFMVSNGNDFYNGKTFQIATKFIDADSAKLDVSRIQIYIYGSGPEDVKFTKSKAEGMVVATIVLDAEQAAKINTEMRRVNKMDDPNKEKLWNETPFTTENYGRYWSIEVSYTVAIKPEGATEFGAPSESYVSAAKNEAAWIDEQEVTKYE